MSLRKPRILLIGAGAFGSKHLKTLLHLEELGILDFAGVVTKTEKTKRLLEQVSTFPIYTELTDELLGTVDAVDVVTPVETHLELVKRCLPHAHVLVEKPLAANDEEALALEKLAKASSNLLMVGHIYRFHPVAVKLRELLHKTNERPLSLKSSFINPIANDLGRSIELELLHPYDIIDFVFGGMPKSKHVDDKGRLRIVSLVYPHNLHAVLKMGWEGTQKRRTLKVSLSHREIECDFEKNSIVVYRDGVLEETFQFADSPEPLETELRSFVRALQGSGTSYPDVEIGRRIVEIATTQPRSSSVASQRKRVAVIGSGIFGSNCAIELASQYDVTLFERNESILSEASHINQYRHHWGYHYPRSQETVDDIRESIFDFEGRYGKAVITEFPTYYSVAKKDTKTSPEDYIEFCTRNNLPFTLENPEARFLDRGKIALSIKTYEPIYDYEKLKDITERELKESGVTLKLGEMIADATILQDGRKMLEVRKGDMIYEDHFDYVVNATYVRHNEFCKWLKFPRKPIRIDLVEALWVKLDIPKISLAVMDGAFTNLVPMSENGMFTLVHIQESILRRFVPRNGLVPPGIFSGTHKTREKRIISRSAEWFPILKEAKVIERHYVLRGVNANREYDDARISGITEHGFGCFSVLGGKIVNAVTTAKQLAHLIKNGREVPLGH